MPVFNSDGKLIGVTQLVNKKKQGEFPPYDPASWPEAPECWRASFNRADQEFMQAFNIQAGVALQNAKLFATVQQQEQLQRDILRSLSNAVISTDETGRIIAANDSARSLLGLSDEDRLEGASLVDLVKIKELDFSKCFQSALMAQDDKSRQQYYPDQTLVSEEELSADTTAATDKLYGLRKMVLPLLKNLMKNPDKEYIYWPDQIGRAHV